MERITDRTKGFTLVEVVLTMTIMAVLVVVTGVLMGRAVDAYRLVAERSDLLQQGRMALMRIEKELEVLRDVVTVQPERVQFRDADMALQEFRRDGTSLFRNSDLLAENVSFLSLAYYRDNGNETQSPPQVRRIHIEMTVQGAGTGGSLTLRTDVFPRNFIYENFQ